MQVGDLVELSAYGKKLLGYKRLRGHQGIVIERVHELSEWKVHWFGKPKCVMHRKEIKQVKSKKILDRTPSV